MKKLMMMLATLAVAFGAWAATISNATAKQRYPWNGLVDITYTLTGDVAAGLPAWNMPRLSVTASNRVDGTTYAAAASSISGDMGTAEGAHHVVWDLNAQGLQFMSDDVVFMVAYWVPRYCVIDLSAGASAAFYPVSYLADVPSGGWTDEYKTTKLVLRLIDPGSFMMGGQYQVTLTKPFYCGIFEVTQKQYELVTGSNPSGSGRKGDMRPVENVSWKIIRGDSDTYNWPNSADVDPDSFIGKIQARTGLDFDLPTEAQWEYACRAGTTSAYNNGGDKEEDLKQLGRYDGNQSDGKGGYSEAFTTVGSYQPNAFGLYDMHGNLWEWCLDWYGDLSGGVTDPVGLTSGSYRVMRGGCWWSSSCTSSLRTDNNPSDYWDSSGFRLARTLSGANGEYSPEVASGAERADALCAAEAAPVAIDSRVDVEPVLDSVVVAWDAAWIGGDANATVVIADNGTEVKRTTGAGAFTHTLTGDGRHELTYTTYIGGVAQEEVYTATVYKDWKYEVRDGGAVITDTTQKSGVVAIPSKIDGYPVTGIANDVFKDCTELTDLTIPDSVTALGSSVGDAMAYYTFNGDMQDSTTNGLHLIRNTGATFTADRFGNQDSACFFNGQAQYVSIDSYSDKYDCVAEGSFTVALWFKTDVPRSEHGSSSTAWNPGNYVFYPVQAGGDAGYGIKVGTDGIDVVEHGSFHLPTVLTYDADIGSGWNHVAVTVDNNGDPKLYLNGNLVATGEGTSRVKRVGLWGIGGGEWGYYTGSVDDVAIFDYSLNAGEVVNLYRSSIGSAAFAGCSGLKSVTMPWSLVSSMASLFPDAYDKLEHVTLTGEAFTLSTDAFDGCDALKTFSFPAAITDFGETDLRWFAEKKVDEGLYIQDGWVLGYVGQAPYELTIPDGVRGIAPYALSEQYDLEKVILPTSLKYLGVGAFQDDTVLEVVSFPIAVETIGDRAFNGCMYLKKAVLGSGLKKLGREAFSGCSMVDEVSLPGSLEEMGTNVFAGVTSLTNATIPAHLRTLREIFPDCHDRIASVTVADGSPFIREDMFREHSVFADVAIPDSVTGIGAAAFSGCSSLSHVALPPALADVGDYAFNGCSKLEEVVLPGAVTNIGRSAFENCSSMARVSIGPNVKSVGGCAFKSCALLTSITLPEGVECLNWDTFEYCRSLASINLPDTLTQIGGYSLYGTAVRSLVIPAAVTNMGDCAFGGNLTNIYYLGDAPTCSDSPYSSTPGNLTSYVLKRSKGWDGNPLSRAKPATWKDRALVEIEESDIVRYAVTFNANGGAFDDGGGATSATRSVTVMKGLNYVFPSDYPQRDGFTFDGWSTAANDGDVVSAETVVEASSGHTLYARWLYATVLDVDGGTLTDGADQFRSGDEAKPLPEPAEEDGRFFMGWYAGETRVTTVAELLAAGGKASARWETRSYIVHFDANGGEGAMDDQTFAYLDTTNLAANAFTRTGYGFAGWSMNEAGVVDFQDEAQVRSLAFEHGGIVTMSAVWTPYAYRVEFDKNSGAGSMDSQTFTYDEEQPLSECAFTRSTYLFAGWALAPDGDIAYADGESVKNLTSEANGTVTLYAVWRPQMTISGTMVRVDGNTEMTIADYFPDDYAKVTTISIADGVTALPDGFFDGCTALTTVDMSDELRATLGYDDLWPTAQAAAKYDANGFLILDGWVLGYRETSATSLVLPSGVKGIGARAFADRSDLVSVTLPTSLKYVGAAAFRNDTLLDNVALPDSVTLVAADAFADCSYLQNMTFGSGLKTIGARAFWGCSELARLTVTASLETIGDAAFSNCWRMQSVLLPFTTRKIASTAFTQCSSLAGVTVPTGIAPMSDWFAPVYGQIRNVTVPKNEKNVCEGMFRGCSSLVTVELPEGITNISASAFRGCSSLDGLALPDSVTAIGDDAFRSCSGMTTFVMPEAVTTVGASAFRDCYSLRDITLSRNLTILPEYVFYGTALDSFTVPDTVNYLGSRFCSGSTTAIYYLGNAPAHAADAYWDSNWNLTSWVIMGTLGWDGRATSRDLPERWLERDIKPWVVNRFDVTFDANGGMFAPVSATTYACEETTYTWYALPPFEPTWTGYKFDGYWTEPEGGTRIYSTMNVKLTKAHTLYAHWRKGSVITVRFNANGGTVSPGERDYTVGGTFGSFPVPTREHFRFVGWYTEADGGTEMLAASEVPSASRELFAHWTPCHYIIRFHANNGTYATVDQSFTYGDNVRLRYNTFSLANCQFAGWALEPGGTAVYADGKTLTDVSAVQDGVIHLYATWTGDAYSVRFDSHGGVGRMDDQTFVIGVAQPLLKCAYTRDGFTFAGWALSTTSAAIYRDCDIVGDLANSRNARVDLFAVWVVVGGGGDGWTACDVSFDAQGGRTEMSARTITSGAELETLPSPVKAGYEFKGWFTAPTGGEKITVKTVVTKDVAYYAHWSENAGGGDAGDGSGSDEGGSSGGGSGDGDVPASGNCTVTFNANGGIGDTTRTVVSGAAVGTLPTATRNGYTFDGWFTAASGGSKISATTKVTRNVTYYAQWTAMSVIVSYGGIVENEAFTKAQRVLGALYGAKGNLAGTVELKFGKINKKQVVKVSGSATIIVGGKAKKITAKAVNVTLDATKRVPPTTLVFKAPIGNMTFAMDADGVFTLKSDKYEMVGMRTRQSASLPVSVGGTMPNGMVYFNVDMDDLPAFGKDGRLLEEALPVDEPIKISGGKWSFGKAASLKYAKNRATGAYELVGLNDTAKPNVSGLKLTYTAKTGLFKGSFKLYATNEASTPTGKAPKLKKFTVNVIGFVVDGKGYGEATLKKPAGTWAVMVE